MRTYRRKCLVFRMVSDVDDLVRKSLMFNVCKILGYCTALQNKVPNVSPYSHAKVPTRPDSLMPKSFKAPPSLRVRSAHCP